MILEGAPNCRHNGRSIRRPHPFITKDLDKALDITPEAVRQHFARMLK
jgi:predicted ArsR family transcriptional regulator